MRKPPVSIVRRGATGPRTLAGKTRSKFNALKHGILSTAAVLVSESAEEFDRFASELIETYRPVGRSEELEVETIASAWWRYRRLLQAEAAEIGRARLLAQRTFAERVSNAQFADALFGGGGAIQKAVLSHSAAGIFNAIDLIKKLVERILGDGLDWDRDSKDLEELFGKDSIGESDGERETAANCDTAALSLPALYRILSRESEGRDLDPKSEASQIVLKKLTEQREFLEPLAMDEAERSRKFQEFLAAMALVPGEDDCDRLIRYEAHLHRILERSHNRLERLQRKRLGQPVLPPMRVEFSK